MGFRPRPGSVSGGGNGGGIDAASPLSVFLDAEVLPGTITADPPRILDFALLRSDSHQAVQPGPAWAWAAPLRGIYAVLATVARDASRPIGAWSLALMRAGIPVVSQEYTRAVGQIAWTGALEIGDRIAVEISAPNTPQGISLDANQTRLVITGAGILL